MVPAPAFGWCKFSSCSWLEIFASVSEYVGVVWSGARFRGSTPASPRRAMHATRPVAARGRSGACVRSCTHAITTRLSAWARSLCVPSTFTTLARASHRHSTTATAASTRNGDEIGVLRLEDCWDKISGSQSSSAALSPEVREFSNDEHRFKQAFARDMDSWHSSRKGLCVGSSNGLPRLGR